MARQGGNGGCGRPVWRESLLIPRDTAFRHRVRTPLAPAALSGQRRRSQRLSDPWSGRGFVLTSQPDDDARPGRSFAYASSVDAHQAGRAHDDPRRLLRSNAFEVASSCGSAMAWHCATVCRRPYPCSVRRCPWRPAPASTRAGPRPAECDQERERLVLVDGDLDGHDHAVGARRLRVELLDGHWPMFTPCWPTRPMGGAGVAWHRPRTGFLMTVWISFIRS